MRPTRWRRSPHLWINLLVAVAVLGVVAAVVAAAALLTTGGSIGGAARTSAEPAPPTVTPAMVPVADSAPRPTAVGMASALAAALANPDLGALTGRVTDALSGSQLWEQGSTAPMLPASTNKVLTAAAALITLNRDARVTTTVVAADPSRRPGLVVLVGGGDPTLSSAPPGKDTLYRGAARISDLADQVRRSGVRPSAVQVDTSAFSGPPMPPGWDPADIQGGDVAPIESVMVDGGRVQPLSPESVRSTTPALDAGRAVAAALGVDPQTVTPLDGSSAGWQQLASVQSAPLMQRLDEMMNDSDNVMAECIAREVAAAMHKPTSFAGAVEAVTSRLSAAKVDMSGATLRDSSGLSIEDRLTAKTLDDVIGVATGPDQPSMRPLLDVLPIAGGSGTLSNRFSGTDPNAAAAGWLRAKTGSLTAVNTLVGIVTDVNGRVLTFALLSNNAGPTGRNALDNVAGALRLCGCGS